MLYFATPTNWISLSSASALARRRPIFPYPLMKTLTKITTRDLLRDSSSLYVLYRFLNPLAEFLSNAVNLNTVKYPQLWRLCKEAVYFGIFKGLVLNDSLASRRCF